MTIYMKNELMKSNQVCVLIQAGSFNEYGLDKGIAHILEHVVILGIKNRIKGANYKGYVDFTEMVIMIELNEAHNDIAEIIKFMFDEQIITLPRILRAKIQIILEIIFTLLHVQKQKKLLSKLLKSNLLEMPIGNLLKIITARKKEILLFYEKFFLLEKACFIIYGKDADILKEEIENYIKRDKIFVDKNEIYILLDKEIYIKIIKNDLLKTFMFLCLESYFYEYFEQSVHIELLNIGQRKCFLVIIGKKDVDHVCILYAIKKLKHDNIPDKILYIAKDIIKDYKGKIFDNDLISNALIDKAMGRNEAFYIQNIDYEKINWKKMFNDAKILIREMLQMICLGEIKR